MWFNFLHLYQFTGQISKQSDKVVGERKKYENLSSLYFQPQILKLQQLFKLEITKFVYNFLRHNLTSPFSGIFTKTCTLLKRKNRSSINSNNLYIPRFRSNKLQRSINYQDVLVWNSIPLEIQKFSKFAFKKRLKEYYIQSYS